MSWAHTEPLHFPHPATSVRRLELRTSVRRAVQWLRQALCGIRGHSMLLHFEAGRLSLQCFACGAHTHGWTIDVRPDFRHAHARVRVLRRAA
jgi:hypothetical protein